MLLIIDWYQILYKGIENKKGKKMNVLKSSGKYEKGNKIVEM